MGIMTVLEIVAVALGFVYVVLAIRRHIACWPASYLASGLFVVVFLDAGLIFQPWLQVFYMVMAVYGYRKWREGAKKPAKLGFWGWRNNLLAVAALLVPVALRRGWGFEPWPIFLALLLLALPPLYLNTYTAIRHVDQGTVDAARAMGFGERSILFRVEFALAISVVFTGIRVAAVQVVATEPIRAFLGGDGLGRYVRDGLGQNNETLIIGGALLIAALAATTSLVVTLLERVTVPHGVRRLRLQTASRRGSIG